MEPVEQQAMDVGALSGDLRGDVVAPGERSWDEARAAWNLVADQHPAAVADVIYFNFAERPSRAESLFDADTFARLREAKRRYDPDIDDMIRANHPVAIA
jgi:hypothetical protein